MEKNLEQNGYLVERHGMPTTDIGINQVHNDKNFLNVIRAYKTLRKEMHAI